MFPSEDAIARAFSPHHPLQQSQPAEPPASQKREPFPAWSVAEDTKKKADAFAKEATRELEVASKKVQAKTGKIEPWTAKYYASCTVGGLLACVSFS
jgi:solute carrier family 25 phosphate transporter 3